MTLCPLQEELDSLVETRDLARKNLYDKLTECVQELEVMPLDVRHQCVSVSLSCYDDSSNFFTAVLISLYEFYYLHSGSNSCPVVLISYFFISVLFPSQRFQFCTVVLISLQCSKFSAKFFIPLQHFLFHFNSST